MDHPCPAYADPNYQEPPGGCLVPVLLLALLYLLLLVFAEVAPRITW